MITVTSGDTEGGIWLKTEGHSEPTEDKEHSLICCGCSVLMVALMTYTGMLEVSEGGEDVDGTGVLYAEVPKALIAHAEFVIQGIRNIATGYPGHIIFALGDSRVCRTQPTTSSPLDASVSSVHDS